MTELHFALLGAAAVILVGLYGWSKWQERKQIRRLRASTGWLRPAP
jgi:hypothetical protein